MSFGKLIVIEGLDGSGKNTQTKLLMDFLLKNQKNARKISFPDYSSDSSALVKMYLNSQFGCNPSDVNSYAASSFYSVDRYASFKTNWESFYKTDGNIIVCDRYTTSNAIYQMPKLNKSDWDEYLTWLFDYEYNKLGLPKPDAVIYLSVPVEVSQKLMEKRYNGDESKKDMHESNVEFLKKCSESAKYISEKQNWFTINCVEDGKMKDINSIQNEIISFLQEGCIL